LIKIEPQYIRNIEALREKYPLRYTLTPSHFHLGILDETISIFKVGYRFMPVVGASAVVESCLLAQKRSDSKWNTLKEYFKDESTLAKLIRESRDIPLIPIGELLDRDENVKKIGEKGNYPKFARLRNKFAHGDLLQPAHNQTEFFSLLPELKELREKYGVNIDDISSIRWDLPGYVQITKCLNFLIKWQENLSKRNT
jgi:hypothetical protein